MGTLGEELFEVESVGDWDGDTAALADLTARTREVSAMGVNRVAVERVAIALMERMILTGDEIRDIVNATTAQGVSND